MTEYDASNLYLMPYPKGSKTADGRWEYLWHISLKKNNPLTDFTPIINELSTVSFKIKVNSRGERELLVNILSDSEMNTDESYAFQIELFCKLERYIGEINLIEGMERNRWHFFKFSSN